MTIASLAPSSAGRFGALTVVQIATFAGTLWLQFDDPLRWLNTIAAKLHLSSVAIAIVMLVCVAALSCLAIAGMLRSGLRQHHPEVSGFAIFFCILIVIGQTILLAMTIRDIAIKTEIAAKAAVELHRSVVTDVARQSMALAGDIGPGLYDELIRFDAAVGGMRTFEIDSHGGIIVEALRVANFLAAKKVTVIARRHCDSACVIIVIASPNAYADADMRFGFHRAATIVDSASELGELGRRRAQELSNEFLVSHGIPGWLVDYSMTIPAWNLVYYPASNLVSWHALAGLMQGNAVVSP